MSLACSSGAPGNTDVKNAGPSGEAGAIAGSTNTVAGATSSGGTGASVGGVPSTPGGAAGGGAPAASAGAGGTTTFRDNLKRFVTETRAAGGAPVLLTPISRRKFSGATITASHGAYPDAVKAVATETTTPLLDLTERTKVWLEDLGPEASIAYFAPEDQTQTSLLGAQAIAGLVASELRASSHPLSSMLVP